MLSRCAATTDREPSRLAADAELLAARAHPGAAHLDNTAMNPEQTLAELVRLVDSGAGRLRCPGSAGARQ